MKVKVERTAVGLYLLLIGWKTELTGNKKFTCILCKVFLPTHKYQHINEDNCERKEIVQIKKDDVVLGPFSIHSSRSSGNVFSGKCRQKFFSVSK